jgi:hypothetical protein
MMKVRDLDRRKETTEVALRRDGRYFFFKKKELGNKI